MSWRSALLSSLGLLSACGGQSDSHIGTGGSTSGGAATGSGGASESSGGAMSSGGGVATGGLTSSGGAAATGGAAMKCAGSKALISEETGFEICDGLIHRPRVGKCALDLPRADVTYGENYTGECKVDSDCKAAPNGYCAADGRVPVTACNYACATDVDCPNDHLCECGLRFGVCVPTSCKSDADCGRELCAKNHDPGPCSDDIGSGPILFACTTPQDACRVDDDCATKRCAFTDGARACLEQKLCGIGRPFLVEGVARVAWLERRTDWLPSGPAAPSAELLPRVAEHYQRAALLEHASVAAFARFTLELLALGAPAELVEAATQAMADETLHARLCFGLASRYSGQRLGPGPLSMADALGAIDMDRVLENVVLEGCIGESVAAEEARLSLEWARDPEVTSVLTRIATDERRHAELAFRFLDWALTKRPDLAIKVRAVVARDLEISKVAVTDDAALGLVEQQALAHGVFPDAWRPALRARVLGEFVAPCIEALCARRFSESRRGARRRRAEPECLS